MIEDIELPSILILSTLSSVAGVVLPILTPSIEPPLIIESDAVTFLTVKSRSVFSVIEFVLASDSVLISLNSLFVSFHIIPTLSSVPLFIINPASLTAAPVTPLARYINESSIERFSVFNTVVVPLIVKSLLTVKLPLIVVVVKSVPIVVILG